MPTKNILLPSIKGVNQKRNPMFLGTEYVHHSTNVVYEEGVIKTRPGYIYHKTGISGDVQGFAKFQPARGLSFKPFAPSLDSIAIAAGGELFILADGSDCASKMCDPINRGGPVTLFQAENYLIAQSPNQDTSWYEGGVCMVRSPGLNASPEVVKDCGCEVEVTEVELVGAKAYCCYDRIKYDKFSPANGCPDAQDHSHDSFIWSNHRNFLINGAGLGVYAHGRIHQEGPHAIYVSDIIHGRGNKETDDILLMEEQSVASMGPPLSTNSSKGNPVAIAVMPKQGSASGEGDIIVYYENGVVSFDTFINPRETRHDDNGEMIQKGWDQRRMVSDLLNSISAVGRYAVTVLPRDHFFRSKHGLHFLKSLLGEATFNDEATNIISAPVAPILDSDPAGALSGAATGHWISGSRMLATTGMVRNGSYSATSLGKGFVSWNQAGSYTDDRTPIPAWDGLNLPDYDVAGVHGFADLGDRFGFVCSLTDSQVRFAEMTTYSEVDMRDGAEIPIEWEIVTGKKILAGLDHVATVNDGMIEAEMVPGSKIRIEVRSDSSDKWSVWEDVVACSERSFVSASFGMAPKTHRDATWIQIRLTGIGHCEVTLLDVAYSNGTKKGMGRGKCSAVSRDSNIDFFRLKEHNSTRWS